MEKDQKIREEDNSIENYLQKTPSEVFIVLSKVNEIDDIPIKKFKKPHHRKKRKGYEY